MCSGGHFSFLLTFGALSRLFGFVIVNIKILSSKNKTDGISDQSLFLYSLVFTCRIYSIFWNVGYLPFDKSGDWLYHAIEVLALVLALTSFWNCAKPLRNGFKFGNIKTVVVSTFVLALLIHPSANQHFLSDVSWAYAMYLESVALIPQLYKFQKNKTSPIDIMLAHFAAALGIGRLSEFLFWVYSHKELHTEGSAAPGYFILFAQLVQVLLMGEFFYFYFRALKNSTPLVLPDYDANFYNKAAIV